jgi:hypothetical protein
MNTLLISVAFVASPPRGRVWSWALATWPSTTAVASTLETRTPRRGTEAESALLLLVCHGRARQDLNARHDPRRPARQARTERLAGSGHGRLQRIGGPLRSLSHAERKHTYTHSPHPHGHTIRTRHAATSEASTGRLEGSSGGSRMPPTQVMTDMSLMSLQSASEAENGLL